MPQPRHEPVMAAECVACLAPRPGAVMVDATVGLGGHARRLLERVGECGRVVGFDRDPEALRLAEERLRAGCAEWGWQDCPFTLLHSDFRRLGAALDAAGVRQAEGFLFDLGVSSMQLDSAERGFSFRACGPLDLRMDRSTGPTAGDLVDTLPEAELARILWEFGEERFSRRIARRVVERRAREPIRDTADLAGLVAGAYPPDQRHGRIHAATRTFQALRIAVNDELAAIEPALFQAADRLSPSGRIVVLSYHSLEDRIVKRSFEFLSGRCRCPEGVPVCGCGATAKVKILTRKPETPSPEEVARNPRSRSARLRAAERIPGAG